MIVKTPEDIHHDIEEKLKNGGTYIDSLVDYAKENNIEIETIAEIVKKHKIIKEKIRKEATDKRMLKIDGDTKSKFFE